MAKTRDNMLVVRMSDEERDLVDMLAKDYGISASKLVRLLVQYGESVRPVLNEEESYAPKANALAA